MKIPIELSYQDFRKFSTNEKKKELLKFLTKKTLQIEINRNIEIGRVPKFSKEINSDKYLVCSKTCFEKYKKKHASELNQRTGVILQQTQEILKNWENIDPFRGVAPPEITFNYEKEPKDVSFK
jgi:hypothetical protein